MLDRDKELDTGLQHVYCKLGSVQFQQGTGPVCSKG